MSIVRAKRDYFCGPNRIACQINPSRVYINPFVGQTFRSAKTLFARLICLSWTFLTYFPNKAKNPTRQNKRGSIAQTPCQGHPPEADSALLVGVGLFFYHNLSGNPYVT